MSRLLGPLSETINKVSARDCALAGENTAGAVIAVLAARADADFRNSRRFMTTSRKNPRGTLGLSSAKVMPKSLVPLDFGNRLIGRVFFHFTGKTVERPHKTNCIQFRKTA